MSVSKSPVDDSPQPALSRVIRAIDEKKAILFCPPNGMPRLRIVDDLRDNSWPLRHSRVKAWISHFVWQEGGTTMGGAELDAILRVLEGRAWCNEREANDAFDAIDEIEGEPVLVTLCEYVREQPDDAATWTLWAQFYADLKAFAFGPHVAFAPWEWPRASWVLSRKVRQHEQVLGQLGLTVERRHARDGNYVRFALNTDPHDATCVTASPQASRPNPNDSNDLRECDAFAASDTRQALTKQLDELRTRSLNNAG